MRARIGRAVALAALALGVWAPVGQAAPGDFDESFGAGGKKTYDFGGPDGAFGLRIQADGKLVLGGYATLRLGGLSAGAAAGGLGLLVRSFLACVAVGMCRRQLLQHRLVGR